MKRKKKILIYIDDDLYIRNYFSYNSFKLPNYEKVIYANNNVTQKQVLFFETQFKGYLTESPQRTKLRSLQSALQLMKFINRSKSFRFRLRRNSIVNRTILRLYNLPIMNRLIMTYLNFRLSSNSEIETVLKSEKPDLIVVPSQVIGSISADILDLAKIMKIPTLFLIDGWDNISSKTVFSRLPDYLAVWGEQSVEHAVNIQNFLANKVFKIGTPRFESYVNSKIQTGKIYDFKYILFTGCAIPFDEISVLKILDYSLTKHNIKDIKIVYRPHPWRQKRSCFDYFVPEDFSNVILDKQLQNYYYANKILGNINAFQPDLNYYPKLLKNCLFVISPLTTMIIEAAITNKSVLTLAYDDGHHLTNPRNALYNYEHFKGIEKLKAFNFCYDIKDVSDLMISMIREKQNNKKVDDYRSQVRNIISFDQSSYSQRLNKIINKILQTTNRSKNLDNKD